MPPLASAATLTRHPPFTSLSFSSPPQRPRRRAASPLRTRASSQSPIAYSTSVSTHGDSATPRQVLRLPIFSVESTESSCPRLDSPARSELRAELSSLTPPSLRLSSFLTTPSPFPRTAVLHDGFFLSQVRWEWRPLPVLRSCQDRRSNCSRLR